MDMCITGMYCEVVYHPPTYLFVRGNDLTMNQSPMNQAKTDTVSETETEQQQRHRERERET